MSSSTPPESTGTPATDPPPTFRLADGPDLIAAPDAPPGYDLLGTLGRGGMGVVYHARQTDLGREVALKMILAGSHASDADLTRFETEVKAIAAVEHPNVVRVHHAGRHRGQPFLVMEYLPGGSLADRIHEGPLPPREAAKVVAAIARGIAACHARGILHRDLKPANVLVTSGQWPVTSEDKSTRPPGSSSSLTTGHSSLATVKVSDFGLAKRLDSADGLTHTGAVLGTPAYMAPEQAAGETVGPAADVYGVGAILYAALTGRPPFQSPTAAETLRRVLEDTPLSVRQLQPTVPRDLETICDKCLHKDAGRRYESADALADDLDRWLTGKPILARPAGWLEQGWKWVRRNRQAAAVIVILAVAVAVAASQWRTAVTEAENAKTARAAAETEADNARQAQAATEVEEKRGRDVNAFFQDVMSQASAETQATGGYAVNVDLPLRTAIDYAAKTVGQQYDGQPLREADVRWTIGNVYYKLREFKKAAVQFERALVLRRKHRPPNDRSVLEVVNNLGESYRQDGRLADAEKLLREAVTGRRAVLGDDPETYRSINNLALLLQKKNEPVEAAQLFRESLEGRERLLGPNHEDTLKSVNNLALFHLERKEYADAERLLLRAVAGRIETLTDRHPDTITSILNLAVFYDRWGKPDQAEVRFREGVALQVRNEPNSWRTARRRLSFAQFLARQRKFGAEAAGHFEAAYRTLKADTTLEPTERDGYVRQAATAGLAFYEQWGKPDQLARWKTLCGADLSKKP